VLIVQELKSDCWLLLRLVVGLLLLRCCLLLLRYAPRGPPHNVKKKQSWGFF
jgi:hypothetical protein